MKKKTIFSFIIGLSISAVALHFALRNVPVAELFDYIKSINYLWILPSVLIILVSSVLRAVRWQIILDSIHKISFWDAFNPLMIGFMINCILPCRIGEIVRPVILQQKKRVLFSSGFATITVERVFDGCMLFVLLAVVLSIIQIDQNFSIAFGEYHLNKKTLETTGINIFKLCMLLIISIFLISMKTSRGLIKQIVTKAPCLLFFISISLRNIIIKKISEPIVRFIDNIAAGFTVINSFKKMCICTALSIAIWMLLAFSFYTMSMGCPNIELSFIEISAVLVIISFFIALPSAPGFWGIWEAGGVFALSLFGVSEKDAMGYTLANHAVQLFPVIIVGIISAIYAGINILKITVIEKNNLS